MLRIRGSFYDGAASWTLIEMTMYYEYFTLYASGKNEYKFNPGSQGAKEMDLPGFH